MTKTIDGVFVARFQASSFGGTGVKKINLTNSFIFVYRFLGESKFQVRKKLKDCTTQVWSKNITTLHALIEELDAVVFEKEGLKHKIVIIQIALSPFFDNQDSTADIEKRSINCSETKVGLKGNAIDWGYWKLNQVELKEIEFEYRGIPRLVTLFSTSDSSWFHWTEENRWYLIE